MIHNTRNTMQRLSSRCYTTGALIKLGWVGAERLYQPPSTDQIWYTGVGHHILLNCPILPLSTDSVATYNRKPLKLCNFRILSSLVAPPSQLHKKSNAGAHVQTIPYPTVPDLLLNSNSFMVIWRPVCKKNKEKNIEIFAPLAACEVPAPSNLAW